jgi:hypothetical protein
MKKTDKNLLPLWEQYKESFLVIPSNLGFTKNNENVMGRGLALKIKEYFLEQSINLPIYYGKKCKNKVLTKDTSTIDIFNEFRLIFFATKPLSKQPWLSWKQDSSLELIEKGCIELKFLLDTKLKDKLIFLPFLGCGNGNLNRKDVLEILKKYFKDYDNVVLSFYKEE